jgi:hypothetical protein
MKFKGVGIMLEGDFVEVEVHLVVWILRRVVLLSYEN